MNALGIVTNMYGEKITIEDVTRHVEWNIAYQIEFDTNQEFFDQYAKRYFAKYGREWNLNTENTVYEIVENEYGATPYYNVAVSLMDGELQDDIAWDFAPCTAQEFFDEYCKRHKEKFGEEFELAKPNPCY